MLFLDRLGTNTSGDHLSRVPSPYASEPASVSPLHSFTRCDGLDFPTQISFQNPSTSGNWYLIGRSQADNVTRSTLSSSRLPVVSQLLNETDVRWRTIDAFAAVILSQPILPAMSRVRLSVSLLSPCTSAFFEIAMKTKWTPSMILKNCNHKTCGDSEPFCGYVHIWRRPLSHSL